jgi:hypothetical protein
LWFVVCALAFDARVRVDLGQNVLKHQRDLPDRRCGKKPVQPDLLKYIPSRFPQIARRTRAVSSHQEGRLAIVTNAGRDAMDADVLRTNST